MDVAMADVASPSGAKRARSSGSGRSGPPGCRLANCLEDAFTDNLRTQKRYRSEVMASNLSRLNMALDASCGALRPRDASCESSPMQTERCSSPARSQEGETCSYSTGASPLSTGSRSSFKSPRQKGAKPRTSPLKASWPRGRGAGSRHMERVAAATAAGRDLPPSPSDSHASMDLRRAALLRSVLQRRESSGLAATATSRPHADSRGVAPSLLELDGLPAALHSSLGRAVKCESPSPTGAGLGLAFRGLGFASPAPQARGSSRRARGLQPGSVAHEQSNRWRSRCNWDG